MKAFFIIIFFLFAAFPSFSNNVTGNLEPVIILYHDGTGNIDLKDISTQPENNRIVYHLLNEILPDVYGINIKMKPIIWARGLELIEAGLADGLMNASYNEERAAYAVYPMKNGKTDPDKMLRLTEYNLYIYKNSTISWNGETLDNIDGEIASVRSYAIVKDLEDMGIDVREEANIPGIMRNLSIGRFKAAALLPAADHLLDENPALKDNIIKSYPPLKRKEYYLIFSEKFYRDNTVLAERIWDAIEDFSSTEEYQVLKRGFED